MPYLVNMFIFNNEVLIFALQVDKRTNMMSESIEQNWKLSFLNNAKCTCGNLQTTFEMFCFAHTRDVTEIQNLQKGLSETPRPRASGVVCHGKPNTSYGLPGYESYNIWRLSRSEHMKEDSECETGVTSQLTGEVHRLPLG